MATNRELRKVLLEKLGITRQALSQRIQKLKRQSPISTEDATYLIAHQEGIKIDKYLDEEQVKRIRELLPHFQNRRATPPVAEKKPSRTKKIPRKRKITDGLLNDKKIKEAEVMADVYSILYVLENSIRELINRVMTDNYGENWWNERTKKGKPKDIAVRVKNRIGREQKNQWHQKRGEHPIYYTDLADLKTLLSSNEENFFPDILSPKEWFINAMDGLQLSRNVLCHMNALDKTNIQDVKVKFEQWQKMIEANISKIPKQP